MTVTRFAPSPTGRLHLGHAYSAMLAHDFARARGGRFLLRIEDIDPGRSREEHVAAIEDDLRWLGLVWDGELPDGYVPVAERRKIAAEARKAASRKAAATQKANAKKKGKPPPKAVAA